MKNLSHKLAAIMTVGALSLQSGDAFATTGLSGVAGNIESTVSDVPKVISATAYIGGLIFAIAGVTNLKNHVENGAQSMPLKKPLAQLVTGGALLAAPTVLDSVTDGLFGTGGTGASYSDVTSGIGTLGN